MKNSRGFSLIEVLVTILLTTIGILGMVALQSKSIQYTQDAVHRNAAVMLTNDLIEIMRSHRDLLFNKTPEFNDSYTELKASSVIYNASGKLQLDAGNCPTSGLANTLQQQGDCWLKQVEETLPGAADLIEGAFMVCPSFALADSDYVNSAPQCAGSNYRGSTLGVQLAWRSKEAVCGKDSNSDICTFTTRVEL